MSKEINLEGYRLAHTMIRVKDLEASFNFYCKTLGMKVLRKTDYPEGKFTNAFIGYGLEGDTWHDIKGNYKRTSSDIELNYSLVGTDKEDSFDIDRKTLKPGINTQCAIINPSINMIKIFKNIQSILISSNENKL